MTLTLVGMTVEQASEKFGLPLDPMECGGCGKKYPFTEVEFFSGCVSLKAKMHDCGRKWQLTLIKPIGKKDKNFWQTLLDANEVAQSRLKEDLIEEKRRKYKNNPVSKLLKFLRRKKSDNEKE